MAHFGGFADHHAHAVVDEHSGSDPGSGVDLDAGDDPADLAEETGQQFQLQITAPQPMAEAMQGDGMETRVAEQDLQPVTGCRVALADNREIGSDLIKHSVMGQLAAAGVCSPISLRSCSIVSVLR